MKLEIKDVHDKKGYMHITYCKMIPSARYAVLKKVNEVYIESILTSIQFHFILSQNKQHATTHSLDDNVRFCVLFYNPDKKSSVLNHSFDQKIFGEKTKTIISL